MSSRSAADTDSTAWERWAYTGAWIVTLAPVVAQALARPMLVGLAVEGDAPRLTLAAWLVALAVVLGPRLERHSAAWVAPLASLLALIVGLAFVGGSALGMFAHGVALACVALLGKAIHPRMIGALPQRLDGLARARPGATICVMALLLLGLAQTAALATFMGDPGWVAGAFRLLPNLKHHACMTAYVQAAAFAQAGVDNLYAAELWPELDGGPLASAAAQTYAPFSLDTYAYPPVFLLFVRPLLALPDFSSQRALWYGLNAGCVAYGLWTVAAWIAEREPVSGTRAMLLTSLVWVTPSVQIALQVGNVHAAMLALAAVAMVCFERGQPARGGALLAAVILTKISPGLLGVLLLVRRRWREAAWTAGFGLLWSLAALALIGPAPFEAFVGYELPRLSSGAALEFFTHDVFNIAINLAPFGIPFKLDALGLELADPWRAASQIARVFTLVVVGLTIWAGRRTDDSRATQAMVWLAVLTLAALRSPFAPGYVAASVTWLLCLASDRFRGWRGAVAFVLAYVVILGAPPMPGRALLIASLVQQAIVLGILIYVIVRPADTR